MALSESLCAAWGNPLLDAEAEPTGLRTPGGGAGGPGSPQLRAAPCSWASTALGLSGAREAPLHGAGQVLPLLSRHAHVPASPLSQPHSCGPAPGALLPWAGGTVPAGHLGPQCWPGTWPGPSPRAILPDGLSAHLPLRASFTSRAGRWGAWPSSQVPLCPQTVTGPQPQAGILLTVPQWGRRTKRRQSIPGSENEPLPLPH